MTLKMIRMVSNHNEWALYKNENCLGILACIALAVIVLRLEFCFSYFSHLGNTIFLLHVAVSVSCLLLVKIFTHLILLIEKHTQSPIYYLYKFIINL